jgi:hypothetical protein
MLNASFRSICPLVSSSAPIPSRPSRGCGDFFRIDSRSLSPCGRSKKPVGLAQELIAQGTADAVAVSRKNPVSRQARPAPRRSHPGHPVQSCQSSVGIMRAPPPPFAAAGEAVHPGRDLRQMRAARGVGRTVHEVVRREDPAMTLRAEKPDPRAKSSAARRADKRGQPPARPAGGEDAEPGDVGEARPDRAPGLRHQEGHARHSTRSSQPLSMAGSPYHQVG